MSFKTEKGDIPYHLALWLKCSSANCPRVFVTVPELKEHFAKVHPSEELSMREDLPSAALEGKILYRMINPENLQKCDHSTEQPEANRAEVAPAIAGPSHIIQPKVEGRKEDPFQCSICKKIFCSKFSMQRHAKVHSGIKPFKCGICRCEMTTKCNVVRHIQNFHNNCRDANAMAIRVEDQPPKLGERKTRRKRLF